MYCKSTSTKLILDLFLNEIILMRKTFHIIEKKKKGRLLNHFVNNHGHNLRLLIGFTYVYGEATCSD